MKLTLNVPFAKGFPYSLPINGRYNSREMAVESSIQHFLEMWTEDKIKATALVDLLAGVAENIMHVECTQSSSSISCGCEGPACCGRTGCEVEVEEACNHNDPTADGESCCYHWVDNVEGLKFNMELTNILTEFSNRLYNLIDKCE